MKSPSIIQSITGTPSVSIWSDALNTSVSVVRSKSEDNFLLTAPARTLVIRSNNIVASWRLSNRGHRLQWFQVGSSMLLRPAPALDGSPQQAHGPAADLVANATSVAAEPPPKRPPTEKIELDIDSLPNYEVLKPALLQTFGGNAVARDGHARSHARAHAAASRSPTSWTASVSAQGPMPKARSTRRASPTMSRVRLKIAAWPLRSARITSKPLIVA